MEKTIYFIHLLFLRLQVTPSEAQHLFQQLEAIDVALVNELYTATMAHASTVSSSSSSSSTPSSSSSVPNDTVNGVLEPAKEVTNLATASSSQTETWYTTGLEHIGKGTVGALILAGGQGTRLGFDHPKGEYNIGLPSMKTIFQLFAERILRLEELARKVVSNPVALPLYIMTSPMTDKDTRETWEKHNYFGLQKHQIFFFCQGTLPCLTMDGKIMLESGSTVAEAPDGNGGIYRALHLSGAVKDMEKRGIVGVHVFAVDNVIARVADPIFLGFCVLNNADVGSKSCPKAGPHEKVGVLCIKDGVYTVVEYSEMDKVLAEQIDPRTGQLMYNTSNICIHYFSTQFLNNSCSPSTLPKVYHIAKKSIPYANPETGKTLTKTELNGKGNTGIKLESFIFDVFPAAKNMSVLEIDRSAEFSPVKNAPGSIDDSPDTARELMNHLHRKWLTTHISNIRIVTDDTTTTIDTSSSTTTNTTSSSSSLNNDNYKYSNFIEISPLVSYGGEGLDTLGLENQTLHTPLLLLKDTEVANHQITTAGSSLINASITSVSKQVSMIKKDNLHIYIVKSA